MTEPATRGGLTSRQQPSRQQLKADRRDALLLSAKRLMAMHGYLGVRLEDIGRAAGISGPAVYRHFDSKDAVLSALLVGISRDLLAGGHRIEETAATPLETLRALVGWQLDFALSEPELIVIYDRDRFQLPPDDLLDVRRTQREYVEIWVAAITAAVPAGAVDLDRTRAHAVLGLINSTPRLRGVELTGDRRTRAVLSEMALASLGVGS